MSQMVLPQTPNQAAQPESGSKRPATADEKSGESRYDSVSQAEQKRLDRKQADERRERPAEGKDRTDNTGSARKDDESTKTSKQAAVEESNGAEGARAEAEVDVNVDVNVNVDGDIDGDINGETREELAALTFADLQAMLAPATGGATTTGTSAAAGTVSGTPEQTPLMKGLTAALAGVTGGNSGKPGENGGNGSGMLAGLQFSEALTAQSAESGRSQDSTSLLASGRVQTLADVAGQQLANATSRAPADAPSLRTYATSVDVPVGNAEWGDKLMGKLTWLTANNLSVAEIHLTPPDMGPMEVRVQVQHDQANITVHSANPAVRDQLELNSHRLRDMLGEHGLSLEQFDVADSSQQQADGQDAGGEGSSSDNGTASGVADADEDEMNADSGVLDLSWKGQVDTFA
ncbi:flagellar hook-length control protein FliK [Marinobacter sp.]|uniref:flagellar hook-length control protein FliK n=1 Tax=Marinobacter sp. TaxID=50741 RepID=UPI0034A5B6E4